jgi:hypothetical protein
VEPRNPRSNNEEDGAGAPLLRKQSMSKFLKPETALARLVEEDGASVGDRVRALRMLEHPPLLMLRRLLHRSRKEPGRIPPRLLAAASLAFVREVAFRKLKPPRVPKSQRPTNNALGI